MNHFSFAFIALLLFSLLIQTWLANRQLRHVKRHRDHVPEAFSQRISRADHQKAADYTLAKTRFGLVELTYSALLLLGWTLGGGLAWLDGLWQDFGLGTTAGGTGFLLSLFILIAVLELPFGIYRIFVIEQRYDFNRITPALFIGDLLKSLLLMLLFAGPLIALMLWLMAHAGEYWWVYAWLVWMGFTLLMLWAYPAFIAPLFNKFTPLEDTALVKRIEKLLERCGFQSNGIFVMDGSRRSSHGNAYFSGLGNNKRIVFFDTLLESLDGDELEAVLAHELGHFRRRHVLKRLLVMAATSLFGLGMLGWLTDQPAFYQGLGLSSPSLHGALALFLLIFPLLGVITQPLFAATLRQHEFEADDFAAENASATALISALVKLYQENANTLTPDPLYSAYHDSHPPAPVRIAHLSAKMAQ